MAAKKTTKVEKNPVSSAQEEKLKALEHALSDLDKQFGKGSVMKLGERTEQSVQVIPTGCLDLDMALGVGGLPRGRVIEIYGPESSGKTTLALHILAEAQKRGGEVAFVDAEHALDPVYAAALGVDTGPAQLRDRPEQMVFHLLTPELPVRGAKIHTTFRCPLQDQISRDRGIALHLQKQDPCGKKRCQRHQ